MPMLRAIARVFLSVVAWIVIVLVIAATLESATGRRMPGLTASLTLAALVPVLFKIWAMRWHKVLLVVWLVMVAANVVLLFRLFSNLWWE